VGWMCGQVEAQLTWPCAVLVSLPSCAALLSRLARQQGCVLRQTSNASRLDVAQVSRRHGRSAQQERRARVQWCSSRQNLNPRGKVTESRTGEQAKQASKRSAFCSRVSLVQVVFVQKRGLLACVIRAPGRAAVRRKAAKLVAVLQLGVRS
jgi:hypothetical protein